MNNSQTGATPQIATSANQSVLIGTPGVTVSFTITDSDNLTGFYVIAVNTPIDSINYMSFLFDYHIWTNGSTVSRNVDTSTPGWINYTIGVTDSLDPAIANFNYSVAWVQVLDPPKINATDTLMIHAGAIGQNLDFTITDTDSANGTVTVYNGTNVVHGPSAQWNDSEQISVPIDTSATGSWIFTINATDGNYTVEKNVTVWIAYSFPPSIIGIENLTVSPDLGTLLINYTFHDFEDLNGSYTLYLDGAPYNSTYENKTWYNGTQESLSVDVSTSLVELVFSINATDYTGNTTMMNFSIYINAPPTIEAPLDTTFVDLSGDTTIQFIILDADNATGWYTVYRNGHTPYLIHTNAEWSNGSAINVTVYAGWTGTQNFTIVYSDGVSTRSHTTLITIQYTIPVLDETTKVTVLMAFIGAGIIASLVIVFSKKK